MSIAPPSQQRQLFLVFAIAIASAVLAGIVLTAVFGPTDNGLHCSRSVAGAQCEILQTRFLGLSGNSVSTIPESEILGVRTDCGYKGIGRASSSCNVNLILASAPNSSYPVLSFALRSQAESATRKLRGYLADKSAKWIKLDEGILTPVLIYGLLPILLLVLILGAGRTRSRR